jgi:hypothetical protein
VEPALKQLPADQLEQTASRDVFFEQLKKLLGDVTERLQEQPVIAAHTENTYDGSGVRRLLSNKFELDKVRMIRLGFVDPCIFFLFRLFAALMVYDGMCASCWILCGETCLRNTRRKRPRNS